MEIIKDLERELLDNGSDNVMKDVTLVGTEGGRVMASKVILALRSPVFRRMFYGHFQEAGNSCDSVNLNFSKSVLLGIVSYCYTDRVNFDWFPKAHPNAAVLDALSRENVVDLVRVRDAANYFQLPKLHESITKVLLTPAKGIDCWLIKSVVAREMSLLQDTEGELWSYCMESQDALSRVVFLMKVLLTIFREVMIRENSKYFIWSTRVERELLEVTSDLYFGIAMFLHQFFGPVVLNGVLLTFLMTASEDKTVIDWEALSSYIEKEKNVIETFLSRVDTVVCDSTELCRNHIRKVISRKVISGIECATGPFKEVVFARLTMKVIDPFTKEDEVQFLTKKVDKIHLEGIETCLLTSIKPCSLFTKERLHNALVKRELEQSPKKRQRTT